MHLHLYQTAFPCHSRTQNRVSRFLLEGCKNRWAAESLGGVRMPHNGVVYTIFLDRKSSFHDRRLLAQTFLFRLSRNLATLLITCIHTRASSVLRCYLWATLTYRYCLFVICKFRCAKEANLTKNKMKNMVNYWIFSCPTFWERILFLVSPLSFWWILYQALRSIPIYDCTNYNWLALQIERNMKL